MELGLQEEAMKLQKPTIDAIGANALATQKTIQDETKKQLEQLDLMKRTQENEGELTRQLTGTTKSESESDSTTTSDFRFTKTLY